MTRQLKIATLGLAAFVATAITDDAPLAAQENPRGKAKVVAEYCMEGIWDGCLSDLSDETALVTMSRIDLGDGIYEDTYEYKGLNPETGEPAESISRVRNYRGLFLIRITFRQRFNLPKNERQGVRPDQVGRFFVSVYDYGYDSAELAEAYARLLSGQDVELFTKNGHSWYESYFCHASGPCNEATNTGVRWIYGSPENHSRGESWSLLGEEVVGTRDGPVKTLLIGHLSGTRLRWYDPISEQVIQKGTAGWPSLDNLAIERRRIRVVPQEPPQ